MSQSYPPNPNEPQRDPAGGDGPPAAEPGQPPREEPPREQEPPRQPPPQQGPPPPRQGQPPYGPGQQGPPSYGPGQPQHGQQHGQQGFPPPAQQRPGAYPGYGPPPTQQYPAPPTQQWPPQQHPQGPPWGGPGGGGSGGGAIYGGSPSAAKTFFPKLFDLSFREFITPSVVKVLYVLAMIGVVFAWLGLAISGFRSSVGLGLFLLLIIGPLYALFLLILLRVTMEFYVAVIRVAEDVRELTKRRPPA